MDDYSLRAGCSGQSEAQRSLWEMVRTKAAIASISRKNEMRNNRKSGNCTLMRQNGSRIAAQTTRLYVPQTAKSREPRKIRNNAPAVATKASGKLNCGLNVKGIAQRSCPDRASASSPPSSAGNNKARTIAMHIVFTSFPSPRFRIGNYQP